MSDVFISHSSKDKEVADGLVEFLESRGISCWIAPRNIIPGNDWAASISTAITASKIFLMVYSENSSKSEQCAREIAIAEATKGVVVVPYKIDNTELVGAYQYYLTGSHWIMANYKKKDYKYEELTSNIAGILGKNIQTINANTYIDHLHIGTAKDLPEDIADAMTSRIVDVRESVDSRSAKKNKRDDISLKKSGNNKKTDYSNTKKSKTPIVVALVGVSLIAIAIVLLISLIGKDNGSEGDNSTHTRSLYPEIIGNQINNLVNGAECNSNGSAHYYESNGYKYYSFSSNSIVGDSEYLVNNTSTDHWIVQYRKNNGEWKNLFDQEDTYNFCLFFVSDEYYFGYDNDQKTLYCLNRKDKSVVGSRKLDDARSFSFCSGYLYYLVSNSKGGRDLYRVPAGDLSENETLTAKILELNDYYDRIVIAKNTVYLIGCEKGKLNILNASAKNKFTITINYSNNHDLIKSCNAHGDDLYICYAQNSSSEVQLYRCNLKNRDLKPVLLMKGTGFREIALNDSGDEIYLIKDYNNSEGISVQSKVELSNTGEIINES